MSCTNCFNGCTETVSDQCIKYTGIDVPTLGIHTGDSLSAVEQSLTTFLVSALNGTGIKIDLTGIDVCTLVYKYLPTCGDITIVDISRALIQAACDLQGQVDAIIAELAILNGTYTTECLTGVIPSSGTHAIVQAIISKLCQLQLDVIALALDLSTNYISVDNIDSYIAAYLASSGASTLISSKMVPNSILPYYGSLVSNFDSTGAGIGNWARIFLCNGLNLTPDLRGRVPVGTTSMGSNAFPTSTNPSLSGNPAYGSPGVVGGLNNIILSPTQIPAHTHVATVTINDPGHTHTVIHSDDDNSQLPSNAFQTSAIEINGTNIIASALTGLNETNVLVANASTGGGLSHSNIQPVISVHYIIYIP